MTLFDLYETYLLPNLSGPLSQTHTRYFLDILDEYDCALGEILSYGTITHYENTLLIGTEYQYGTLEFRSEKDASDAYSGILQEEGAEISLYDLFLAANEKKSDHLYIPVYADKDKLFCVCTKDKKQLLDYLRLSEGGDIYEAYPVFLNILGWGISFIAARTPEERAHEQAGAELEKGRNYIHIKNDIVTKSFYEMHLPYPSTIHMIAGWKYEGASNLGCIDFYDPYKSGSPGLYLRFDKDFQLSAPNARTIRKYVELSDDHIRIKAQSVPPEAGSLLADDEYWHLVGIGPMEKHGYATLRFDGDSKWRLATKREIILYNGSSFSFMRNAPREPRYLSQTRDFYRELESFTGRYDAYAVSTINAIIEAVSRSKHGTMLLFMPDAGEEAKRLCSCGRGMPIDPLDFGAMLRDDPKLALGLMQNLSKIDGAVLFDEHGVCYAIGTIVDGRAQANSNPGRGARYNSAFTYVRDCNERKKQCYCVVVSEDETIDIFGMHNYHHAQA